LDSERQLIFTSNDRDGDLCVISIATKKCLSRITISETLDDGVLALAYHVRDQHRRLYVCDWSHCRVCCVDVSDESNPTILQELGKSYGPARLQSPCSLVVDSVSCRLLVLDHGNSRVVTFDLDSNTFSGYFFFGNECDPMASPSTMCIFPSAVPSRDGHVDMLLMLCDARRLCLSLFALPTQSNLRFLRKIDLSNSQEINSNAIWMPQTCRAVGLCMWRSPLSGLLIVNIKHFNNQICNFQIIDSYIM